MLLPTLAVDGFSESERPEPLLRVDGLTIAPRSRPDRPIVADISLDVSEGGALGIVGESGSGKSLTTLAMMGLLPLALHADRGTMSFGGVVIDLARSSLPARHRGAGLGLVLQDPAGSLNPMRRVGSALAKLIALHQGMTRRAAREAAARLLADVGLPDDLMRAFPHELSGGQAQRAMLACALSGEPAVLIADEPTTALDVTTQAQILELIASLRRGAKMALIIVSHDFGVIAHAAEEVAVMYAGRIVEVAPVRDVIAAPMHPYTHGLIASMPPDRGGIQPAPLPPALHVPSADATGCAFAPRCARRGPECRVRPAVQATGRRKVACHRPLAA